jgi:ParB/RepB/Spo0J family partition protein
MEFGISRVLGEPQQVPAAATPTVPPTATACMVQPVNVVRAGDGDRLERIPIDLIDEPSQPRQTQDPELLARMSASIDQEGLLSPITVSRSKTPGRFNLEEGGQRLKATKLAGKTEILGRIIEPVDETRRWLRHLQSNHLRASLLPGEEALGLAWVRDSLGLTSTQLAQKTKMTLTHVSRRLSLLKFGLDRLGHIDAGRVSEAVAGEIAKVANEKDRDALFDRAVADSLEKRPWTKDRAISAVSAITKRRKARQEAGKGFRRVTFKLGERGGAITIAAPEHVAELDTETAFFAVEFAFKALKKAVKENVPASKLAAFFQKATPKTPAANPMPPIDTGSTGPPPSAN